MKTSEIRKLSENELLSELNKASFSLLKAHMEQKSGSLKETHLLKKLRRDIARLETIKKENLTSKK